MRELLPAFLVGPFDWFGTHWFEVFLLIIVSSIQSRLVEANQKLQKIADQTELSRLELYEIRERTPAPAYDPNAHPLAANWRNWTPEQMGGSK